MEAKETKYRRSKAERQKGKKREKGWVVNWVGMLVGQVVVWSRTKQGLCVDM